MGVMYKSKETNLDFCDQKGYGKFYLKYTKSTWPSTLFAATEKQTIKANWQSVETGRWFYSIFDVFTCFENFINIFQTYSFPSLTSRSSSTCLPTSCSFILKKYTEKWNMESSLCWLLSMGPALNAVDKSSIIPVTKVEVLSTRYMISF